MLCCIASPPTVPPQGEAPYWSSQDVNDWLKYKKLGKLGPKLKNVTGQGLLSMSDEELKSKAGNDKDTAHLLEAVAELKQKLQKNHATAKQPPASGLANDPIVPKKRITKEYTEDDDKVVGDQVLRVDAEALPKETPERSVAVEQTYSTKAPPKETTEQSRAVAQTYSTKALPNETTEQSHAVEQTYSTEAFLNEPTEQTHVAEQPCSTEAANTASEGDGKTSQPVSVDGMLAEPAADAGQASDTAGAEIQEEVEQLSDSAIEESHASQELAPEQVTLAMEKAVEVQDTVPAYLSKTTSNATQADVAVVMQKYTPDADPDSLATFTTSLGKFGAGFKELESIDPTVGAVFGSAYQLHVTASAAVVNRENCQKLDALGQDVLRSLDAAGKKKLPVSTDALEQLAVQLNAATDKIEPFAKPGWMMHMVCDEKMKEDLDSIHNRMVDTLKEQNIDTLATGKSLPRGDYRDVTKGIRRMVKQAGSGSLTTGMNNLKEHDITSPHVMELAGMLDISPHAAVQELRSVPMSDLDLDTVYSSFVQKGEQQQNAYRQVFDWYDKDGNGCIDQAELKQVLQELGLLEGKNGAEIAQKVANDMKMADTDGNGSLSFEEFCQYYGTLSSSKARQQLRIKLGLQAEEELRNIFEAFAGFGTRQAVTEMDGAKFFKLCKDCQLVDQQFTSIDVDIIFAKVKTKGQRKIGFDGFLHCLQLSADKKGLALDEVVKQILAVGGPIAHATLPDNVRLHDDKSTYTGVYAKGGPKFVDPRKDLAALVDRESANKKPPMPTRVASARIATQVTPTDSRKSLAPSSSARNAGTWAASSSQRSLNSNNSAGEKTLQSMFIAFANFGAGMPSERSTPTRTTPTGKKTIEMDNTRFIKLCRETELIDKNLSSTRADLIFTQVKPKGQNKINYDAFLRALQLIAEEKVMAVEDVMDQVASSEGPMLNMSYFKGYVEHL